jgi:hypothetical protein
MGKRGGEGRGGEGKGMYRSAPLFQILDTPLGLDLRINHLMKDH